MKAVFVGGVVVCYLLFSFGVIDRVDGILGGQESPDFGLPTYLSFLSVMLTAVTTVLGALAIGIGVVAAYTFREMRADAQKAVVEKIEEALSEDAINSRIDEIAFGRKQMPTVAELEEGFDSEDNGNR